MKILIVAGPYEADRIRRAAVSAGVEAVAVEPGESLSGWITATRPEVIVLAPKVISAEPSAALAKVRAVKSGRVPILLVGDAEDEAELRPLGDGFFVRPIAADDLIQQARAALAARILRGRDESQPVAAAPAVTERPAPPPPPGSSGKAPLLRPLVAAQESAQLELPVLTREVSGGAIPEPVPAESEPASASGAARARGSSAASGSGRQRRTPAMFDQLAESIDADIDADLQAEVRDVVRAVDGMRRSGKIALSVKGSADVPESGAPASAAVADAPATDAVSELTDESSQKTLEVPQVSPSSDDEIDLDPPTLLARMYLSRLSGRLTLRQGKVKKHVVFERGHPVLAASSRVEDRLGEMLVREGRLTPAQASSLGDEAAASGRRLGLVLVDRGLVAAAELTGLVRRHYEEIIYSLFSWDKGAWNLGTDSSIAAEKVLLSLHPAALILEGIRRAYGAARTIAALGGPDEVFQLRASAGLSDLLDKMGLDAAERRAVLSFDGLQSLAAIAAASGVVPERVHALAWALFVLDRLEPAAAPRDVATSPVSSRGAAGGNGAEERDEARDEIIDRALVQARLALVADGDYFQILGVPRDASSDEIRRAHDILAAGLAPGALHPTVAADLESELSEIRLVLDEASRLLGDERVRQSYREHLSGPIVFGGGDGSGGVAGGGDSGGAARAS